MIHVLTVHFGSAKWIDIQLDYLRRHLSEPYRVVANLEGVPDGHADKFDQIIPAMGKHAGKLNLMAAEVASSVDPDDLIMFLDGDAFPIADPMPTVHRGLEQSTLVAVRRAENGEDQQPHPCFCVIRAGDWIRIRGDWSLGYCWTNAWGELSTDTGGNLLAALERNSATWTPILRSNRVDLHPLWFAVYGDIVYHHGAGFRVAVARSISAGQPKRWERGEQLPVAGTVIRMLDTTRINLWQDRQMRASQELGESIYGQIGRNPEFYRQFV